MLAPGLAILLISAVPPDTADCASRGTRTPALRVMVVSTGESDPEVARAVAALGANVIATLTSPNPATAAAAESAGVGYWPRLSTREIERMPWDTARIESLRRMPAIAGFQYLDDEVTEGYTSAATQARVYGILKALFPDRLVLHATRLDPIATDPDYLATVYRPEFTDLVVPYFYPVGTTVLGDYEETDPWENRLRSLIEPLAAATPAGKPILPVLQAFEQHGFPVRGGLPRRQLQVYAEVWPDNDNVAAFWWGGPLNEPFIGISDHDRLERGMRELFGAAPSRVEPCRLPRRAPIQSPP